MISVRHLAISILLGISLLGEPSVPQSQTPPARNCRYFNTTGYYVCDKFLDFFETRGGLEMFGYPLTQVFVDPTHSNLRVQYFQRARMEEHPSNPPPYEVQLGLLVDELGYTYPPGPPEEIPDPDDRSQHYFPETQHVVSHAFLDFFRDKGGLDIFGYPRSEMVYKDDLVVQYFQRARMEWDRERAPGQQIVLANVGEEYIERFGIPGSVDLETTPSQRGEPSQMAASPNLLHEVFLPLVLLEGGPFEPAPLKPSPSPPPAPTSTTPSNLVTALNVSAFVRYAITGRTGTQTVYIYVTDQQGRPVPGATVQLTVHYKSGDVVCTAKPTEAAGSTQCSFEIVTPPVGEQVVIDIMVIYDGLTATTQTSYVPWW